MNQIEKRIKSKIFFFYITNYKCEEIFNRLHRVENEIHGKRNGFLKLKKCDYDVYYDSMYEKKILEELDSCSFVKKIKTQSLIIPYKARLSNKKRRYIPDIQLLLTDGSLAIIEIKPYLEMVNSTNMRKHKALRKYCKENGYGFAIIDKDLYSFEDLKKEKVSEDVQKEFIDYVKDKKKVTFNQCKEFKKKHMLNNYQLCYIIWKNNRKLLYQQYYITAKKIKNEN